MDERDDVPAPVRIGRLAPYPVWLGVTLLVRSAQLVFLLLWVWYLAALFDAMDKASTISPPPIWLLVVSTLIGASSGRGAWQWRTSPFGDALGKLLASERCPACGQSVFDHTPPSGYAPPSQQQRMVPSRICTNCGHDLMLRTAA
ncbi:hypothetical protein E2493_20435 [Sphingomonas parva]|uniref:Uncharacterized protein n=1 Tax=Sphingomonas parva TaxID=2555898 RepID=A0A4Y8ZK71_9SPHN|nr:hypothetical protein [Sphingomonas parva]TFI56393.1 hypothetical protein E2493_20435 [Sphingomonas parva]